MGKILERIYVDQMRGMEEDEMSLMLKKRIRQLLKDDGLDSDQAAYERSRDLAFRAAGAGEEVGFYRGFRSAVQLFMECRG